MMRASSCHSCVWMQVSPLNFTNVAACTEELALSLSRAPHTRHIYLYAHIPIPTPQKGHGIRDTLSLERTWEQRYPTPM